MRPRVLLLRARREDHSVRHAVGRGGQHPVRFGLSALGQRVAAHGGRAAQARRSEPAREGQDPRRQCAAVLRSEGAERETIMTHASTTVDKEFHERMHAAHMYGLWELASEMTRHPEPKAIPYLWPSALIDAMVRES